MHKDSPKLYESSSAFWKVMGFIFKTSHYKCLTLLLVYTGLTVLKETGIYYFTFLSGKYLSLGLKETPSPTSTPNMVLLVVAAITSIALLSSSQEWILYVLKAVARNNLTTHLQRYYMRQSHFHHVNKVGMEYHPDQVITHDSYRVCHFLVKWLHSVVSPLLVISFYMYKTASTFGLISTSLLVVYFVIFVGVMNVVSIPLKRTIFVLQQDEGGLRLKHASLREHTEHHHVSNSLNTELEIISSKLKSVVRHMRKIATQSTIVEFFKTWFQFSSPVIILCCYRYGALLEMEYGGAMGHKKLIQSTVGLLLGQKIVVSFIVIINSTETFVHLKAHISRVSKLLELYEYIDEVVAAEQAANRSETDSLYSVAASQQSLIKWNPTDLIVVSNLRLYLPINDRFIGNTFNFAVKKSRSLGITGPNGCGKSTLVRFLAGLLKPKYGVVSKSFELDAPQSMLTFMLSYQLPTTSTIYDKLVYPCFYLKKNDDFYTNADCCLKSVGLSYLCTATNSPHDTEPCPLLLSTGEQQRLMFAKIIFFRPTIAVIDEWIYCLPDEFAIQMFNLCMERGVTFVTVSQNINLLKQTHHCVLNVDFNDCVMEYLYS